MEDWIDDEDRYGVSKLERAFRTPRDPRIQINPEAELSNFRVNDWEEQGSPRGADIEPPEYELAFDPNAKQYVSDESLQAANLSTDLNVTLEEELSRFSGIKPLNSGRFLKNVYTRDGPPKCSQDMAHRSLHDLLAGKEDFSYVEGESEILRFSKSPVRRNTSSPQSPSRTDILQSQQSLAPKRSPDAAQHKQTRLFTERDMMQRELLTTSFQQQETSKLSVSSIPDRTHLGQSAWAQWRTIDTLAEQSGLYRSDESRYGIARWEEEFEQSRNGGHMTRFLRMVFTVRGSEYSASLPDENTKQLVIDWASSWLRLRSEQIGVDCYHTDCWHPAICRGICRESAAIRQQNPQARLMSGELSMLDPNRSHGSGPTGLSRGRVDGGCGESVLRVVVSIRVGSVRSLPNERFQSELKQEMTHILSTARSRGVAAHNVHLDCYFASSPEYSMSASLQPQQRSSPEPMLEPAHYHEQFGNFHERSVDSLQRETEKMSLRGSGPATPFVGVRVAGSGSYASVGAQQPSDFADAAPVSIPEPQTEMWYGDKELAWG